MVFYEPVFWILFLLGAYLTIGQGVEVIKHWAPKEGESGYSMIPLIGGCLAAFALYLNPYGWDRKLAIIPLIVDLGCLPLIAWLLFAFVSWLFREIAKEIRR